MPQAAIGLGAAGVASNAASGKNAKGAAQQQLGIQKEQLAYGKDLTNTGMSAWTPASNYYKSLLSGDRGAVAQAIGPTSQMIRQSGTAQLTNLANALPAGGEKNLALSTARLGNYSALANLYSGVQPAAADALGRLSQVPISAGTSIMGQAAPNTSAPFQLAAANKIQGNQNAQGLGSLLYGMRNGGGGKGGGGSTGAGSAGAGAGAAAGGLS